LKQDAAEDYDPFGSNGEHHAQAKAVVDGDTGTFWSTETYEGGTINNKPGVGIYVIADPTVAAREMQIITPTKGWAGGVYVAEAGPAPKSIDGWKRAGDIASAQASQRVALDTARNRYRYYLVWITKLPPGASKVEIAEIRLFR
ncbi:MAG: eukaryotic-like serine/threonine-protein kinase, partial [Solirubrobacteraceae bacterium]|nr:eukaryotic-like serine/threonine-protein kinase [Solirubrobacteraceae bacterium]